MIEIDNKTPNMSSTSTQKRITKGLGNRVLTSKIKLYVRTEEDRSWLNKAFGNARWNYNKAVEMMNNPTTRNEQKESCLTWRKFLRSKILNSDCDVIRDNTRLLELGYDIRDDSVKDVLTATKGNMTKLSKGDITKFRMRYRNRKKLRNQSTHARVDPQPRRNTLTIQWPKIKHPMTFFTGSKAWNGPIDMPDANEHK